MGATKRIAQLLAALTLTVITLAACDGGYDCSIENIAYNRIGFYNTNSYGIEQKFELQHALTVSLMVNGKDSIVVNHIQGADALQLPVSYTHDRDTVIFSYDNTTTDTLYINHENIQYYQSMECGTVMYHKLESIEHTEKFIDSVAIVHNFVNFDSNENVKIYFIE